MSERDEIEALADALRAEPPAISDAQKRGLVSTALREARARRSAAEGDQADRTDDDALVDAAAELLASADAPALDEAAVRDRARDAMRARPTPLRRRFVRPAAFALAVAAALGLVIGSLVSRSTPAGDAIVERTLPDGHRVVAAPGCDYRVESERGGVVVGLEEGEALFVVQPLDRGASFVVDAGDERVRVTGTVFTVERRDARVRVRVYEGAVEIDHPTDEIRLAAGDGYDSGGAGGFEPVLHARAVREAARRAAIAARRGDEEAGPVVLENASEAGRSEEAVAPETTGGAAGPEGAGDRSAPARPAAALPPAPSRAREGEPERVEVARRLLGERRYDDALDLAERALARPARSSRAEWQMMRGDALRGLGRPRDALATYEAAMEVGTPDERAIAGLAAARVLHVLEGPTQARRALEQSGALAPGSPVRAAAQQLRASLDER